jgi:hypothetical protein
MNLQILFLLILAFAVFIIVPIALIMSAVEHFRHKASDRPTGGDGASNFIGGTMGELDRFIRPSVEHQVEAQQRITKPSDNKSGD